ncbi:MAG: 2-phospho-L-lactate transferase [Thaumarchaeota archaeon]|nr:2-phospho-L-lactate transferase [Candidatus Calditenuaceae archaeon]
MIALLSGGVGGSRLAAGLYDLVGERLVVIVNTADDEVIYGLYVSPDVDTVLYALSGIGDWERGWGIRGDTFRCNETIGRLGFENWFKIGDMDLAVNLLRTKMLREGMSLSEVTGELARRMGIRCRVIPMTDFWVETRVVTKEGTMSFQEYFVKRGTAPEVLEVRRVRSPDEAPAPGVVESLTSAQAIFFAPSNPILSVRPILETKGVEEAIRRSGAVKVAVSPIVGGRAMRGPADRLMVAFGYEPGVVGVAQFYEGLIDGLVIDRADEELAGTIRSRFGIEVLVTDTLMTSREAARWLAGEVLNFAVRLGGTRG